MICTVMFINRHLRAGARRGRAPCDPRDQRRRDGILALRAPGFDAVARDQVRRVIPRPSRRIPPKHRCRGSSRSPSSRASSGCSPRHSEFPRRTRPPVPAVSTCAAPWSPGCRIFQKSEFGRSSGAFLNLLQGIFRRSPICHGRGEHGGVGRQRRLDRAQHVARRLDPDHAHPRRIEGSRPAPTPA